MIKKRMRNEIEWKYFFKSYTCKREVRKKRKWREKEQKIMKNEREGINCWREINILNECEMREKK